MILTINQGKIRGNAERSAWSSKIFYSFLGIPFAEPPIGDLRFKPPVKAGNWKGVFTAFKEGKECYQTTFKKTNVEGSEDCLYLNVFIPEKPNTKNLKPVMVNVHGGGFSSFSGSPKTSSPDHLMESDVILVTFNYRLHVLGFLNLGLSDCPGNMGLKDQLLAFQWVKENIECFGGDPDNITLFGQSAGASSIHLHMMSSLSDGLFHKCILQSGSAQSVWSFCECPEERAFELAFILGYRGNAKEEVLMFLKNVSVERLSAANDELRNQLRTRYPGKCSVYPFVPSVERIKQGAILPRPPNELLKNTRKIPTIIGMNEREGGNMFIKEPAVMQILQNNFEYVMKINTNIDGLEHHLEDVKHFYFKNGVISGKEKLSDLYTDLYFKHFYELENILLENPETLLYTYEFCYDGSANFFKYFFPHLVGDIKGAIHADDHFYIFGGNWFFKNPFFKFTPNDINVTKFMCRMWSNFAKTGNPNGDNVPITWRPTTKRRRCYLKIDKTLELKYGRIHERRYEFWENLKLKLEKTATTMNG